MRVLAKIAAALLALSTIAAVPYQPEKIVLLQPDAVLRERVPSVQLLSDYIKAIQAAAQQALSTETPHPTSGFLVLAVRPAGQSMVWLDFTPSLPEPTAAKLKKAVLAVPPFEARQGVVVFALSSSLWGAAPSQGFPNPPEWRKAMQGHNAPLEVGSLVNSLWPGRPGT
ncbi:MAG: hypothetical protein JSR64_19430 [Nitrospira sp.]|nr:hypothetical protein [Nitrospira sp.]MBS0193998.1 hypothetical protein [Pseudomonadota bacterium]